MFRAALIVAAVLMTAASVALAQELHGVWVTTDASVDTSSPEAIVKGLVKPGMNDEQKVLAIFNWYRRVIFPHNYLADDRRDVLRQINSYGCTLCGSHAANLGWLMRTAGFTTRCVFIHDGGHTFIEVQYDNGWHAVDPETDFAVWSRPTTAPTSQPHLVSMEEVKADPTLLDNAEKEGRAKAWLFKAMKFPFATRKKMADWCDGNKDGKGYKDAMQWSSSVLKGETIKDYFLDGLKTLKYSDLNEPYQGRVSDPNLMKLTLRPGERIARCWDNEGRGKFIAGQGFAGYPAYFMASGEADETDPEVFPFVEPYRKDNYGIPELEVNRCYRYSGNGHVVWTPNLGAMVVSTGVIVENLGYADESKICSAEEKCKITIPIHSSYSLVRGRVRMGWTLGPDTKAGKVFVLAGKGEAKEIPSATQPEADLPAGQTEYRIGREINGLFNYALRIELPVRSGLHDISFDHTFVNNPRALPFLAPGKNVVRVRLDNPDELKKTKLVVKYEWAEGDGWKTDKADEREVTGSPFEYELTVAGPKYPRMKSVTLEAAGK